MSADTGRLETLAKGQVRVREWRCQDSTELVTELQFVSPRGGLVTATLIHPTGPPWWADKRLADFEIEQIGHQVEEPITWPPPWPYWSYWLTPERPFLVRLEQKRIHRRGQSELYAEIRLPDMLGEGRIVEPATFHGIAATTPDDEVLALKRAVKLAYQATADQWGRPGRPRTKLSEDELAEAWWKEYNPGLGRATKKRVAERLVIEPSWFKTLFHRLHLGLKWADYRPAQFRPPFDPPHGPTQGRK